MATGTKTNEGGLAIDTGEPIAVIGLDIRLPGDASNPQAFWDMLLRGGSALGDVPPDRYNIDAFFHPDHERAGTVSRHDDNIDLAE
jgi:acyl transferase domain-containing protein